MSLERDIARVRVAHARTLMAEAAGLLDAACRELSAVVGGGKLYEKTAKTSTAAKSLGYEAEKLAESTKIAADGMAVESARRRNSEDPLGGEQKRVPGAI